jgi:S1-C subfamily serine protease
MKRQLAAALAAAAVAADTEAAQRRTEYTIPRPPPPPAPGPGAGAGGGGGLGLTISEGGRVLGVRCGSPAAQQGVVPGARIVAVDGVDVTVGAAAAAAVRHE